MTVHLLFTTDFKKQHIIYYSYYAVGWLVE